MDHDPARRRCGPISWCALPLFAFLVGCVDDPFGPTGSFTAKGCDGETRVIGYLWPSSKTCEDIVASVADDWAAAPLFPGDDVPPSLNRYCLITPKDTDPSRGPKVLPPVPYTFAELVDDSPVVYPQGTTLADFASELALEHRQWIHDAAGGLESLPSTPMPTPIELDIIDNAPNSMYPGLPAIPSGNVGMHGSVLAHMARDIGCPEGSTGVCPTRVVTKLAMQDSHSQPKLRGTRGELARAIYNAVNQWKRSIIEGRVIGWRLVLNISLGWEDEHLWYDDVCIISYSDSGMPYGEECRKTLGPEHLNRASRAVYDALVYARCHGVLLIAAKGNWPLSYSHRRNYLMSPGQFMQWNAPRDGDKICENYGADDFKPTYQAAAANAGLELTLHPATVLESEPLVYPVGAVDFGGRCLEPHRPLSMPDLVGPGLLGASYEGDYTRVKALHSLPPNNVPSSLTGSSVGALTASAVAATVWAYSPQVSAADVMNIIYNNGETLYDSLWDDLDNDIFKARPTRHISLCKTLRGIGILGGALCPDALGPSVLQNPPISAAMAMWSDFRPSVRTPKILASPIDVGSYMEYYRIRDDKNPHADLECEVGTQPTWATCTNCALISVGSASSPTLITSEPPEMLLDLSELTNQNITNVHLVVVHPDDTFSFRFPYGSSETIYGTNDGPLIRNLGPENAQVRLINISVEARDRVFLDWTDSKGWPRYSQIASY